MTGYARSDILVDTAWLQQHLGDPDLRIVDCDLPDAYGRAHIPGAVNPADHYYKDPADRRFIAPPAEFAAMMAKLGIGNRTLVVGYDASGLRLAARLWWSLNYYGHTSVRILNGGWPHWLAEGRPVTMDRPRVAAAEFTPGAPDAALCASAEDVMSALTDRDRLVLDVRSDAEWEGREDRGNRRAGHMPGAVHREWSQNLEADGHLFKPADQLRAEFAALGVSPDREVITVCQAGVRAALALVTLKLIGYEQVRNYDGSFFDWANRDDTPLV
jgi:thiosulfate/3-mercaptopyruvate sulfurtransferase